LDSKYNGKVIKLDKGVYFFSNVNTTNSYTKEFKSEFLKKVLITPYEDGVKLKIEANSKYTTSIALTPEGYGIRVRIKRVKPFSKIMSNKELKQIDYATYILVIVILVLLGLLMILFKRKRGTNYNLDLKIVFQRAIDPKNKIVLIEYQNRKYLVLVGTTNILLDIFDKEMISIKGGFDEMLKLNDKMEEIKRYIKNAEELKEINERI
jgi:flagellar biogenesis protein FliO